MGWPDRKRARIMPSRDNAREVVSFTASPAVATIRARTREALESDSGRTERKA